jgi:LysR family transcriptional regulator for bpeEF and oprC
MRLFHRTTRQVTLSKDGEDIYTRCQRILEDVEELEMAAADVRSGARGTLRIDMPMTYGRRFVLPVLMELKQRHPALKIDARFSDHMVDIIKEGLAAHGEPQSPSELTGHTCLLFRMPSNGRDRPWQFRTDDNDLSIMPESSVRLGEGEALAEMAAAGLGIVQLPSYLTAPEVKQGRLVEILQIFRPTPFPISLVYPGNRHIPQRVRALAEALTARGRFATG